MGNPQNSNVDQESYYRFYFFKWPGLFNLYEQHPGFNAWFLELELGRKRTRLDTSPNFQAWVNNRLMLEYDFFENKK